MRSVVDGTARRFGDSPCIGSCCRGTRRGRTVVGNARRTRVSPDVRTKRVRTPRASPGTTPTPAPGRLTGPDVPRTGRWVRDLRGEGAVSGVLVGNKAVIGRNHSFLNSLLISNRIVSSVFRNVTPHNVCSRMISTAKYFILPNMVSSRIRFHRPKLAHGTSVRDRDHTTTCNNIASCVRVPGAIPRAARLRI